MSDTPFTDKAWNAIPHHLSMFEVATKMTEACRKMERQRNELLKACMMIDKAKTEQQVDKALDYVKTAIAKAKGETP